MVNEKQATYEKHSQSVNVEAVEDTTIPLPGLEPGSLG